MLNQHVFDFNLKILEKFYTKNRASLITIYINVRHLRVLESSIVLHL